MNATDIITLAQRMRACPDKAGKQALAATCPAHLHDLLRATYLALVQQQARQRHIKPKSPLPPIWQQQRRSLAQYQRARQLLAGRAA